MEGLSKKQEAFEHAVFLFRLKFFTSKNTRLSLKECKLSNNLGKTEEERSQMVTFSPTNVSQYLFWHLLKAPLKMHIHTMPSVQLCNNNGSKWVFLLDAKLNSLFAQVVSSSNQIV